MLGYITIGTADMDRATGFWDQIAGLMGGAQAMKDEEDGRFTLYGAPGATCLLGIFKPYDGNAPEPGNGNMIALSAPDRAKVDEVYKKAIDLGGTCEGEPGERTSAFYGAYFRDLDGNKVCVFKMG